jgi:hypothetical protein
MAQAGARDFSEIERQVPECAAQVRLWPNYVVAAKIGEIADDL